MKKINDNGKQKQDINNISEEDLSKIKLKSEELEEKISFSIKYSDNILEFINYIKDLLYEQINKTIKENLNNISFFDFLSKLYSDLSNKLKNSDVISNDNNENISNLFKDSISNIKNLIEVDFSTKSENFKRNTDNYNNQVKQKEKKIEEIKKNIIDKYNEVYEIKNILLKKYSETYDKLFIIEIKQTNVIELPDLVIAIIDLTKQINLLNREINILIEKFKESLIILNNIINEINKNFKDIIASFINESKNNFNNELNQKILEIEKKIDEYNPKETNFSFSQLLNNISQRNIIEKIFKNLSFLFGFSENWITIEKYKSIDSFFEFLIQNKKEIKQMNIDELIIKKIEVQYYPGFLKSWKDCFLFSTAQKHLIICDNKDILSLDNVIQIFEMDKINFKLNSKFEKPFMFELSPNYSVLFKRYNTYTFDALNSENLFQLCLVFKDYISKKED